MTVSHDASGAALARGVGHAKAIVIGEHFVLDGAPALATALPSLSATVELWRVDAPAAATGAGPRVLLADTDALDPADARDATAMLARACALAGLDGWLQARLQSTIPVRRGLGSSAALAVAAVRAAWRLAAGREPDEATCLDQAREIECVVHGRSSGLDPAAAAARGAVLFQRGRVIERVPVSERLASARWLLLDLGASVPTREAIAVANAARAALPAGRLDVLVAAATQAALDAAGALRTGELAALADAMKRAARVLEPLGVVDARMREVLAATRQAGALAAKQTGAGLGGTLLALAPDADAAEAIRARVADAVAACWILPLIDPPA